ncbi:MAG: pyridoxamine kinase [Clostridia bacterium]|nr:pyridoxamine kinase [Clostridia bacterium]
MSQKKAVAIHDISGFGRCSLTVALPLISAAGVQTSVIPTAVLSTHTGGFKGNTFCDLTNDIEPIAAHWKRENISFDAIYTGYLCSEAQVLSVISAVELLKNKNNLLLVDPVMGDNGKLYSGFSAKYPQFMLRLCKRADIITPNITEAAALACLPLTDKLDREYIELLSKKLYSLTKAKIVLTGVSLQEKHIGAYVFDGEEFFYISTEKLPVSYHGTGDIFASVLTASLLNDRSLKAAVQIAVNFTAGCIKQTVADNVDPRYGVNFEGQIPNLLKFLEIK